MHALRRARQRTVEAGGGVVEALASVPTASDTDLNRELASVLRSDLTMVCSEAELYLLTTRYHILPDKLVHAPFFCNPPKGAAEQVPWEKRHGFVTVGSFRHPPNVDSVQWLAETVWPLVRARLPTATMDVFGSYPTSKVERLHDPKSGLRIRGFAKDLSAMNSARVLLCPLRFGAGIKGKIVDAWNFGLPVVTTPIGAEGIVSGATNLMPLPGNPANAAISWGGFWDCVTAEQVAEAAVKLHENKEIWQVAQSTGISLVNLLFPKDANISIVLRAIDRTISNLSKIRDHDYAGSVLWFHTSRSTLYFSKWIELKETGRNS